MNKAGFSPFENENRNDVSIRTENHRYGDLRAFLLNKIHKRFKKLKNYIYFSFFIIGVDILIMFIYDNLFNNLFNILSTFILLASFIYSLVVFKDEFNIVDKTVYKQLVKVISVLTVATAIFYLNIVYIFIFKGIMKINVLFSVIDFGKIYFNMMSIDRKYFFANFFSFVIYFVVNSILPIFIVVKLQRLRQTISKIGKEEGQDYSVASSVPVQTERLNQDQVLNLGTVG